MGKIIANIHNSLETLKLFWSSFLENGSVVFDHWSEQSNQIALEVWNLQAIQNAHTNMQLVWQQILESWLQTKCTIQQYDLNFIFDTLQSKIICLTGYNFNRTHIYIGCAGLFVGSGVGFLIGISVKPSAITVTHMKAASATSYNGIEGITLLEDVVTPEIIKPNQVMITVRAAAIDPLDVLVASGYGSFLRKFLIKQTLHKSLYREFPLVLGRDCSGVVIDIGSEVRRDLNINDEVWVSLPPWAPCGTLCETIVVPDKYVVHKPRNLSHEQAATLPYSGSMSWLAVFQTASLNPLNAVDKKVLVYCGDTGTGSIIVQLCCYLKTNVTVISVGPHRLPSDSYGFVRQFFYVLWLKMAYKNKDWDFYEFDSKRILNELTSLSNDYVLRPVLDKTFMEHELDRAFRYIDSGETIGKVVIKFSTLTSQVMMPRPSGILF